MKRLFIGVIFSKNLLKHSQQINIIVNDILFYFHQLIATALPPFFQINNKMLRFIHQSSMKSWAHHSDSLISIVWLSGYYPFASRLHCNGHAVRAQPQCD